MPDSRRSPDKSTSPLDPHFSHSPRQNPPITNLSHFSDLRCARTMTPVEKRKDLRLVRVKFTHVSRGFAFIHFYSVEDATKALEATNGTTLEKNGQIHRVAFAKSIIGSGASRTSHSSSLAAAAIEAATFAQHYDAVGWVPKEYNPDDEQTAAGQEHGGAEHSNTQAPQSGFVWDESSGYYYDAAFGFYYDGNTGSLDFLEVASELKLESLLSLVNEVSSIEGVVHFSSILMHCIAMQARMC